MNRQPHLFAKHNQFPFRYIYDIPGWVKSRVCTCDQFDYSGIKRDPHAPIQKCDTCSKYNVYLLFVCIDCEEYFLKDFKHPRFCSFEHFRCWECLRAFVATSEDTCCERVQWYYDEKDVKPPLGIKFKRMSKEEIDAILGEDFGLDFEIIP